MTCKDCVHLQPCKRWAQLVHGENLVFSLNEACELFKNNTSEIPFTIGQPMWKLCTWFTRQAEVLESRVSMIQQKADKSWKVRISNRYGTEDFKAGDVGTYLFLTKEAAEKALEEFNEAKK